MPRAAAAAPFTKWVPLAREVAGRSLALGWNDVLHIYSYVPTIPLAEALALEARRRGSDTVITLMTDDLWFTSMQELPERWLKTPSAAEQGLATRTTALVYLGGPADARRFRTISPARFTANTAGGTPTDLMRRRRHAKILDLAIGRLTPERADAYGLDYGRWRRSYDRALGEDLSHIRARGSEWVHRLAAGGRVRFTSANGTDLTCELTGKMFVDDGIIDANDIRHGFLEATLPAGKVVIGVRPGSAEGAVRFTESVFLGGRSVRGLRVRVARGTVTDARAEKNADVFEKMLPPRAPERRVGWLAIGLNPSAAPVMLDNSIVDGMLSVGLGSHPAVTRGGQGGFELPSGTVEVARLASGAKRRAR